MKKIKLSEKQKKIIDIITNAFIGVATAFILIGLIGSIITKCTKKEEAEIRKVYALEETKGTTYTLPNISFATYEEPVAFYTTGYEATITFTNTITLNFTNKGVGGASAISNIRQTQKITQNTAEQVTYVIEVSGLMYSYKEGNVESQDFTTSFVIFAKKEFFNNVGNNQITITEIPTYGQQLSNTNTFKFGNYSLQINIDIQSDYIPIKGAERYLYAYEDLTQKSFENGYNKGIKDKKAYGQTQYTNGYNKGVEEANNYSFTGLISAVFDVPIQTIFGMLNFEILGVNILTIVTSILSIALLIFVLKMIFG